MVDQKSLSQRAENLRNMSAEVSAAPILSRVAMAQDLVGAAIDLLSDMAERIEHITPYIDESDDPAGDG